MRRVAQTQVSLSLFLSHARVAPTQPFGVGEASLWRRGLFTFKIHVHSRLLERMLETGPLSSAKQKQRCSWSSRTTLVHSAIYCCLTRPPPYLPFPSLPIPARSIVTSIYMNGVMAAQAAKAMERASPHVTSNILHLDHHQRFCVNLPESIFPNTHAEWGCEGENPPASTRAQARRHSHTHQTLWCQRRGEEQEGGRALRSATLPGERSKPTLRVCTQVKKINPIQSLGSGIGKGDRSRV